MSTGSGYRALETSLTAGSGDVALEGAAGTAYRKLVTEIKAITGVGTGPWSVDVVVTDDVNFEVMTCNLEEGTGPLGKDLLKKSTGAILRSSNGGSAIIWGANVKNVFLAPLASKLYALFDVLSTVGVVERLSATSFAIVTVSAYAKTLLDDADAATARTTLSAMDRAMAEQSVLTTRGDLLIRNASAAARLALGASGRVVRSDGTDSLWAVLAAPDVSFDNTVASLPGSPTTVKAAIDALDGVVDPIPFKKAVFTSSAQTITAAGALTIAHGLAVRPPLVLARLVCQTGELGYTAADEVDVGSGIVNSGGNQGHSLITDATNLNLRFASGASTYAIPNKTSGATTNITNANWKIVFLAFA